MASPLLICAPNDVIIRFGGLQYVNQLMDSSATGTYDPDRMTTIIKDGSSEVASFANVAVQVDAWRRAIEAEPTLEWPHLLVDLSANQAVVLAWRYYSQGQAMPAHTVSGGQFVMDMCEKIRLGQISIGAPPQYPTLQPPVKTITTSDPYQDRMTLSAMLRYVG